MNSQRGSGRHKRKYKRVYKFSLNKLIKLLPAGNILRDNNNWPKPRSGHRIIVRGGSVYAIGGYTPNFEIDESDILFKELWKYNIASKTWALLETTGKMPEQLASHCAALFDNHMLIFGGTGLPFGETCSNTTYSCNLDTLEWEEIETTGPQPNPQYGQAMIVDNNKMYVVGGTNGFAYSMFVHCLDLATKEWTFLEANSKPYDWLPEPRYRHEIAIDSNKLFVFGGGTVDGCYSFKEIPVFNLVTNIWSKIQTSDDYPQARRCHACVQIGSDVYICGGFNGRSSFDTIWKFNLKILQWQRVLVHLPEPLYFHSAAVSEEGQLFVFGGVSNMAQSIRSNNLYSMWLKIPTLQDMCWQAVLKYIPHLFQVEKMKLYEVGVPFHLLKEIDFGSPFSTSLTPCCHRLQT